MQTNLAPEYLGTLAGQEAEAILRKCVHCGFCTATCPTYQTLGDELDGPRGRIYLIKQVLEGQQPTRATQEHLDRCLTCRNCETTCPSGVQYGHLVDIGRKVVEEKVKRPMGERLQRWALREGLTSPLFAPAMKLGQSVRSLLPESIQAKVPPKSEHGVWPSRSHARKVLLHMGCVQPAMLPNINYATARVLDAVGIEHLVLVTLPLAVHPFHAETRNLQHAAAVGQPPARRDAQFARPLHAEKRLETALALGDAHGHGRRRLIGLGRLGRLRWRRRCRPRRALLPLRIERGKIKHGKFRHLPVKRGGGAARNRGRLSAEQDRRARSETQRKQTCQRDFPGAGHGLSSCAATDASPAPRL